MAKLKFFGYDPDNGFELFETAEQAINYANDAIDYYRGESCDGWDEQVEQVCWGELKQETVMIDKKPDESGKFKFTCDFKLEDI